MRCCEESEFEIVAGDDFGFEVEILNTDNTPAELDDDDSIEAKKKYLKAVVSQKIPRLFIYPRISHGRF